MTRSSFAPLVPIDVITTGKPMIVTDTLSVDERFQHIVQPG